MLDSLKSENRNSDTLEFDQLPNKAVVHAIKDEDQKVVSAIQC